LDRVAVSYLVADRHPPTHRDFPLSSSAPLSLPPSSLRRGRVMVVAAAAAYCICRCDAAAPVLFNFALRIWGFIYLALIFSRL
jgi:hypothetical protein